MDKVLRLKNASQALNIAGVNAGSIVEMTAKNGDVIDKVALEINANTNERAVVLFDNLLTIDGHAIFGSDNAVAEL